MRRLNLIILSLLLLACSDNRYDPKYDEKLWGIIKASNGGQIDISKIGIGAWTKVCFMGPYNTNTEKTLGFEWSGEYEKDLALLTSDGHNLIIFVTDSDVTDLIVQNRGYGDFWKLSGQCLQRGNTNLVYEKSPVSSFVQAKSHNK